MFPPSVLCASPRFRAKHKRALTTHRPLNDGKPTTNKTDGRPMNALAIEEKAPTPKEIALQLTIELKSRTAAFHRRWMDFPSTPAMVGYTNAINTPLIRTLAPLLARLRRCEQTDYKEAALDVIPLGEIYAGVEKREEEQDMLKKKGRLTGKEYGYQEFIVLELLKWYKHSFFKWVNTPELPGHGAVRLLGGAVANSEERAHDATSVEVYQAEDGFRYRFPRYNDTKKLLTWRQGRCGEWNICFYQILRAMDIKTRYVWNAEDHVWLEMYSNTWGRWVHIDSCEEAFDNPSLYNKGWGKKMSYCIAVGLFGIQDVTKRYVVDQDKQLPRTMADERLLKKVILWQTVLLRQTMDIDEKSQLFVEDCFERLGLNGKLKDKDVHKDDGPALPRQTGAGEWTNARGENGN